MKALFLILFVSISGFTINAQSVLGKYDQKTISAPTEYRDGQNKVVVSKDSKSPKKIWVSNLVKNQKFYAVLHSSMDGKKVYAVPNQTAGGYKINAGCITFDESDEDGEQGQLVISLNNKINCLGMDQNDYNQTVSVGKDGVSAGGVKVGKNGNVSVPGVGVKNGKVKVNAKEAMAGIQYIGQKQGMKKSNSTDDDEW